MRNDLGFVVRFTKITPLNSNKDSINTIQSIDDLIVALSEGERTNFFNILNSLAIPSTAFESFGSWSSYFYTRNCIIDNEDFELILLCWEKGQLTPIHDHGGEECWVKVITGEFKETIYKKNISGEMLVIDSAVAKQNDVTYMIDFMGYHRLENVSNQRSMSLHLYAKPIRNCNLFDENSGEIINKVLKYHTIASK